MNNRYTYEVLSKAVSECFNYSEVMRYINAPHDSYRHVQKMIISYDLDTSHFKNTSSKNGQAKKLAREANGFIKKRTADEILIVITEESHYRMRRNDLMYAMLSSGLEYKCMMDGCEKPEPIWRGEPCSLDIDHIDGNWRNCKLENLRFLCGRCHYQVDTNTKSRAINPKGLEDFIIQLKKTSSRKNKKCLDCSNSIGRASTRCRACQAKSYIGGNRIDWPPVKDIIEGVQEYGFSRYAKTIGASDNGIRKHLQRQGITKLPKRIKH